MCRGVLHPVFTPRRPSGVPQRTLTMDQSLEEKQHVLKATQEMQQATQEELESLDWREKRSTRTTGESRMSDENRVDNVCWTQKTLKNEINIYIYIFASQH